MKTDKTKQPGQFKYISLGDIHLGHRKTPTSHIIKNLELLIHDDLLKSLDMVIITGDLFDRQLVNGDELVHEINRWMTTLLMKCARHDVMLRIVEGTPSHDRMQPKFFIEQRANAQIPVDLHYASELSIEYIERIDAYFLYVPDKWRPSTAITLSEVKQLLELHKITQVDFAIMHGAFAYQYPDVVPEPTHDEAEYLAIVKYQILIGHVHISTVRDRIYAAGSFDRLGHNDEIPKGMFSITVKESGEYTATFVENRKAKQYVTLNVHEMNTKELFNEIKTKALTLPPYSAIRLRCEPNAVATGDVETFRIEYPQYHWSTDIQRPDKKKETINESLINFDMSKYIDITAQSISELLIEDLCRITSDEQMHSNCLERLEGLL